MLEEIPPLRLVVGGGQRDDFPKLKRDDVSVNVSGVAMPHVQADVNALPFVDNCFQEVYYEFVPFSAFTGEKTNAIAESARVLQVGGRLIIHTGRNVKVSEVTELLRDVGFKYVRVTTRGYVRFTGRLSGE